MLKQKTVATLLFFTCLVGMGYAQSVQDNFEGTGTISTWAGDDCGMDPAFSNPNIDLINPSSTILKYDDFGGQY
ncbi:MAG TPA: beta-glucanase, partial [Flavobacteriales bacterium]|nr:beta-glucanase [Flavobacteriales bacterium]